jgi:hypothetical protein
MSVKRLGIVRPQANVDELLTDVIINFFSSVIITNLSETETANLTIYVKPQGSVEEAEWVYIIYNFPLDPFNSLETQRFALNPQDEVWVRSSIENVSFLAEGIPQRDISVRYTTGTFAEKSLNPVAGDLHFATDEDKVYVNTSTGWKALAFEGN